MRVAYDRRDHKSDRTSVVGPIRPSWAVDPLRRRSDSLEQTGPESRATSPLLRLRASGRVGGLVRRARTGRAPSASPAVLITGATPRRSRSLPAGPRDASPSSWAGTRSGWVLPSAL